MGGAGDNGLLGNGSEVDSALPVAVTMAGTGNPFVGRTVAALADGIGAHSIAIVDRASTLVIEHPAGTPIVADDVIDFGTGAFGGAGAERIFTLRNPDSVVVTNPNGTLSCSIRHYRWLRTGRRGVIDQSPQFLVNFSSGSGNDTGGKHCRLPRS